MGQPIKNKTIPLFLRQVFLEKQSGRLALSAGGIDKALFFSEGNLVNATSRRFDEKILIILHLVGKISEEQYNFISGMHQFSDDQVGRILIDHQFVSRKDLYYARIYQFRRIALSTFSQLPGEWSFTPGGEEQLRGEAFEIPLAGILIEGARGIDRVSAYAAKWLFHIPRPLGGIPDPIRIYYTDEEVDFFSQLRECGTITCREVIARLNLLPIDFWRKVLAFHLLGALEFVRGQFDDDVARDIGDLLALHEKIQNATSADFALLGLSEDSSTAGLDDDLAHLQARFAPERFGSAAAPEIKKIAQAVQQYIELVQQQLPSRAAPAAAPAPAAPAVIPENPTEKAWYFYMKGKEQHERGEISEAIDSLKEAIRLNPDNGDYYFLLGQCQNEISQFWHEAEANLKKAIELKPWSAEPVYALGVFFRNQKKLDMAERCFRRVKEISLEHTGASRALVDLRRQKSPKKDKLAFLKKKIF